MSVLSTLSIRRTIRAVPRFTERERRTEDRQEKEDQVDVMRSEIFPRQLEFSQNVLASRLAKKYTRELREYNFNYELYSGLIPKERYRKEVIRDYTWKIEKTRSTFRACSNNAHSKSVALGKSCEIAFSFSNRAC